MADYKLNILKKILRVLICVISIAMIISFNKLAYNPIHAVGDLASLYDSISRDHDKSFVTNSETVGFTIYVALYGFLSIFSAFFCWKIIDKTLDGL